MQNASFKHIVKRLAKSLFLNQGHQDLIPGLQETMYGFSHWNLVVLLTEKGHRSFTTG
jgi:hypothetical protein